MRRLLLAVLAVAFAASLAAPLKAQGAPPQGGAGQPYTVEYYYKCQWGHQQEFLELFLKNHYPLLKKIQSTGRIVALKIESPAYHTTEDGRWDYRVTIRYKDSTVAPTSKLRSSRSYGPTRRLIKRKSSAGLRFLPVTGICR
jgi:hypothetical protein